MSDQTDWALLTDGTGFPAMLSYMTANGVDKKDLAKHFNCSVGVMTEVMRKANTPEKKKAMMRAIDLLSTRKSLGLNSLGEEIEIKVEQAHEEFIHLQSRERVRRERDVVFVGLPPFREILSRHGIDRGDFFTFAPEEWFYLHDAGQKTIVQRVSGVNQRCVAFALHIERKEPDPEPLCQIISDGELIPVQPAQ